MLISRIPHFNSLLIYVLSWSLIAVPITAKAAPPLANPDQRTIPANSSVTINVLANDSDPDGDAIRVTAVSAPTTGRATINADGSILYTAEKGFAGGNVVFTYTIQDDNGETAQADVTVTIQNQDFAVLTPNRNNKSLAESLKSICNVLRLRSDASLSASQFKLLQRCNQLETLAATNPDAIAEVLTQIAPEETASQMRVAVDASRSQSGVIAGRVQQHKLALQQAPAEHNNQKSFALNGREWIPSAHKGGGASEAYPSIWSRLGAFASVQTDAAERERTEFENGYDASAINALVGVDYFLNQHILLGTTVAINQNTLDYLDDGGTLDTQLTVFSVFSAYFYQDFSVYAQLGYGRMNYESVRKIQYGEGSSVVSERAEGQTTGAQTTLNTRGEWTWNRQALSVTPFFRLDYLSNTIKAYGERNGGGFAMILGQQETTQMSLAAGIESSYVFTPSWGVLRPKLGLTYQSERDSSRNPITSQFAVESDSDQYELNSDGGDSGFYHLTVGSSAVFKHGISAFCTYTKILGYDNLRAHQIQFGARWEL